MTVVRLQAIIHWLAVTAVVCFALQVFSDNKADVDLWGNVGFVHALPGSDAFLTTNTFSYTEPDTPWINHEWLAEYLLHGAWQRFGNTGLLLLKVLLGLGVLALMYATLRRECRSGVVRFLFMLLIISTMGYGFSTRPHHFSYLFLALFLYLLKRFRLKPWLHLIVLPVLGMVWANLHGAFFIGAVILLVHAIMAIKPIGTARGRIASRDRWQPLVLFGGVIIFVAATLINPYGIRLWSFVFASGGVARTYLSEWQPFSPIRHGMTHLDFVVLAVIVCCAYSFSNTKKDVVWTTLVYLSLLAAIVLRRNIPLFAIVAGFMAGRHLDAMVGESVAQLVRRIPAAVIAGLLALFIPASLYAGWTFNKDVPYEIEIPDGRYPVQTVAFMKAHALSGNLFVFFDWAEYCIWHLYPECRVFMDGRFLSAYSEPVVEDYLAGLYGKKEWERVLDAYPTDMVLVHYGNPLALLLRQRKDWVVVHADGPALLFVRRSADIDAVWKETASSAAPTDKAGPARFP